MVSENYPQLRATEAFQYLQAQLEGTENRISVERNNFNAAVQEYNTALGQFPTNMLNKMFTFSRGHSSPPRPGGEGADSEFQLRQFTGRDGRYRRHAITLL